MNGPLSGRLPVSGSEDAFSASEALSVDRGPGSGEILGGEPDPDLPILVMRPILLVPLDEL